MNNNTCRICFGEETDDDELGRLFSPCKCKGTMKYVHVNCLEQWRRSSGVNKSFYECGQCKYKYNLSRLTLAASIANEALVTFITSLSFIFIVGLLGSVTQSYYFYWINYSYKEWIQMTEHLEFENSDIPVFKNLPRNLDNVDISISPFSPILWISGVLALGTIAVLEIIMASRYHFNFDRRGEGNIVLILVYLALVGYGVFKSIKYLYQQSRNKLVMWGIKPAEQYVLEVHEESE